jgi:hypothetical protein
MMHHSPSTCRAATAGIVAALCMASAAHADIVISSGATSNVSCTSGVCTPSAPDAVLNVGDLETLLASGNVKLAAAGEPVDVDIDAPLSWVSTNTLTLDSYHAINVQQPVAITGGGGLALITNDGGTGGEFAFLPGANVAFLNGAGSLAIDGNAYTLVTDIATLASDIAANPGGAYALAGNYNAAPDGTYGNAPITPWFTGSFQGLGNVISNLSIASSAKKADLALFTTIGADGSISNLVLQNISVTATGPYSGSGGLAIDNEGAVFGVHVSGLVSATGSAGGLTGGNIGNISHSSATGIVSATRLAGGLVGSNDIGASIDQCFSTASIDLHKTPPGGSLVGGLVGESGAASITNSYAAGPVSGGRKAFVGGFLGEAQDTTISSSYASGAVKGGIGAAVGGIFRVRRPRRDTYACVLGQDDVRIRRGRGPWW